ncbi:MAG: alanine dehydrogenase [Candidatus Nealsonbacteria bacterium]|nr:alanine dehydrogenase [Candidatus Nealsonbacteria bacterium]
MLILNQKEVKDLLPLSEIGQVIDCTEKAFLDYAKGKVQMPPKSYLYFKQYNGDLRIMPAFATDLDMAGTKIVSVHPENSKKGLPTVMAVIILNDSKTGFPLALMDGTYITGMRTGAAGAIAVKYLARKEAKTLGVAGAGKQALFQIVAISKVRPIEKVFVCDLSQKNITNLANSLLEIGIKIEKASIEEVARQDILVTTTPSEKPIIKREWIMPGTHINAIGADAAGKEELDPEILKTAKVVIDDWAQASHSGEINVPFNKGIIAKEDIYSSLGKIVNSEKIGRENDEEITVFDSTGLAIQDLFAAHLVYCKAREKYIGKEVDLQLFS